MNIQEAGQQIEQAIAAYLLRDKQGRLRTTVQQQRPPFLYGPPGIGKTEIVQQIATKLGIGFVDYSMTHHTRQSALGLPVIATRTYGGVERKVSDYTMSEILSSVYDQVEAGQKEGILFLDEVNCVSETLAPAMMKFLQYKTFGKDAVPEGWVVVTAGNPPEYNNSVKEYDAVTWDRLKRLDVEANYESWRQYSQAQNAHTTVISYLDNNKDDFYKNVSAVDGRRFITARAWSDLSKMIQIYEDLGYQVDINLVKQYIQEADVARHFANHYQNFMNLYIRVNNSVILDGVDDNGATLEFLKNANSTTIHAIWMSLATKLETNAQEIMEQLSLQKALVTHYKNLSLLSVDQQIAYLNEATQKNANSPLSRAASLLYAGFEDNFPALAKQRHQESKDANSALHRQTAEQVDNVFNFVQTLAQVLTTPQLDVALMWTQCLLSKPNLLGLFLKSKSKYVKIWSKHLNIQDAQTAILAELDALEQEGD